jgi:hypothetical protein
MRSSILVILIVLYVSCNKENKPDCFKSAGEIIKEQRTLPPFTFIQGHDNIEIILTSDSIQTVVVEAGKNLFPKIITEVNDYGLIIKNNNTCNWVRSHKNTIKVYIGQPALQTIFQYGSENISTQEQIHLPHLLIHQYGRGDIDLNLVSDNIDIDLNGAGNITLTGNANAVTAHTYNLGQVNFGILNTLGLSCKSLTLKSETQADAYVSADSIMNLKIKNTGNIYYSGNAFANLKKEGEGNFIRQ